MTEIERLIKLLEIAEIPHEVTEHFNAPQVWYPSKANAICDAVSHIYCYGGEQGLLEIMGLVPDDWGDEVQGYLTGAEVFVRMANHYIEQKAD